MCTKRKNSGSFIVQGIQAHNRYYYNLLQGEEHLVLRSEKYYQTFSIARTKRHVPKSWKENEKIQKIF